MIRLPLILFVILAPTSIFAQTPTPVEAKTSDGRTVILKTDGTWEFKKVAPQPSSSAAATSGKPVATMDSLPPNFGGNDARVVYMQLLELKKRLVKSEFETTAQHQTRVATEAQKPIVGDLTLKDTFALLISDVEAEYDADSQKMRFSIRVPRHSSGDQDKRTAYDLSDVNLYSIHLDRSGYGGYSIFFDDL